MDRIIGATLVLLALIHLANCQESLLYNYTGDCIKITVEISINITYLQVTGHNSTTVIDAKDILDNTPFTSQLCNDSEDGYIEWANKWYTLTLNFRRSSRSWEVSKVQFEYFAMDNLDFHNPKTDGDTVDTTDTGITNVELGSSYKCNRDITYTMTGDNSTVYLTMKDLQLQAFRFNSQGEFGKAKECAPKHGKQQVVVIEANMTCILIKIIMKNISITYLNKSGNKILLEPLITNSSYKPSVICNTKGESRSAKITIGWPRPDFYYNLSIAFTANYKKGQQGWNIANMTFQYISNSDFIAPVEGNATTLVYNKPFTDNSISLSRSYKCDDNKSFVFTSKDSNSTATLFVSFIQLQAFQFSNPINLTFGSAMECDQGATPVIVPILVGSILGLFVIILLLAYVAGRFNVVGRCKQLWKAKSGYRPL